MDDLVLSMRKFVVPEFVFGDGAADLAGRYARNLGAKKVLLVSDKPLLELGWPGQVSESIEAQGLNVALFTDVTPNPRAEEVMAGAEVYDREGCEAIVAVGGGSPIDCAKGIGIVCTNRRHVLEFVGVDKVEKPGPPLICLPTTLSAAEISQVAVINDTTRKVKTGIVSKAMVPDAALIDPLLTTTMGPELTANTGMDALTHAIEAYVSNANSPITDLFALEALRLLAASFRKAIENPGDRKARGGMMLGGLYAGMAFSNAVLGATHAMSHSLGAMSDLPHGLCVAHLLEHVIAVNFVHASGRYAKIAKALGAKISARATKEEKLQAVLETVRGIKRDAGIKGGLSSLGIKREDFRKLAQGAVCDPCMHTNPCKLSVEELENIYEQAY